MDQELSAEHRSDIVVIGGGPTGLFAAFYAGMREMSVKIVDSLPELGGQLSALYPEKYIYDMPGFPRVKARSLIQNLVRQANTADLSVSLNEQAIALDRVTEDWLAIHTDKDVHITRTVVLCGGVGSFTPRKHKARGIDRFLDRGVYHFVKVPEVFRDKRVLIVGGGDSACDYALQLQGIARHITVAHRRDVFQAHEENAKQLMASSAELRLFSDLVAVNGNEAVESVTLREMKEKTESEMEVDAVILAIGFQASLGPILDWGLHIERGSIRVDSTMATNLPGVFAAGDIVTYPGKLKLIATAVGEAATAVNHAKTIIDPNAKVFPGHSSNKDASAPVKMTSDS